MLQFLPCSCSKWYLWILRQPFLQAQWLKDGNIQFFFLYGLAVGTIIYPVFGNWVWGGGWLAQLGTNFGLGHGHVDFAGSSVVHMTGGVIAFVGAKLIGHV